MNQLEKRSTQTPIELLIHIDENGMTTSRNLYEFLELDTKNYSRWCKANITDNEFAEENTDYEVFVTKEENPLGGRPTQDFKLSSDFAKKLAMISKSQKGEEARDYFIKVEDKLKKLAKPKCIEDVLIESLHEMKAVRYQLEKQDKEIAAVQERVENIREVVTLDPTAWREEANRILKKIGTSLGGGEQYGLVREESYKLFSNRMGYDLKTRLTNRRKTMAIEGASRTKINNTSYMDIIASDKRMIECYVTIIKEMAIKYGVA